MYGGKAIGFATSIRVRMDAPRTETQDFLDPATGVKVKADFLILRPRATKNKTGKSKRSMEIYFRTDTPMPYVDIATELTGIGKTLGIFTDENGNAPSGNVGWYFNGEKIGGSGEPPVVRKLREDEDFLFAVQDAVEAAITNNTNLPPLPDFENGFNNEE